jgi:hypothetical protein
LENEKEKNCKTGFGAADAFLLSTNVYSSFIASVSQILSLSLSLSFYYSYNATTLSCFNLPLCVGGSERKRDRERESKREREREKSIGLRRIQFPSVMAWL